ncbi:hypothetical protein [Georgenia sp. SUBG003]|uniref:hypothetical protein n=1 Tax=Georgenia sp. SUBG003 TaxID=1497974 RepID=UPI0004D403D8|nr:hypothetical protein DA06_20495 [Georgenia sp. SUBG003]
MPSGIVEPELPPGATRLARPSLRGLGPVTAEAGSWSDSPPGGTGVPAGTHGAGAGTAFRP